MKVLKGWLDKYVGGLDKVSVDVLVDKIHHSLAEVEGIEPVGEELREIIVAKVVRVYKHPKADRLWVTHVDIGGKIVTVVTGADNLKIGDFVPYTPIGAKVPVNPYPSKWDGVVRKKVLVGIESEGMLNSEYELGLGSDHSQIMVLNDTEFSTRLKPGTPLVEVLRLNDYLIEIENKALTHRGDLFGVLGMAQEVAGLFGLRFMPEKWWYSGYTMKGAQRDEIIISPDTGTLRYSVAIFKEVKARSTPWNIRSRLAAYGMPSHNFLVDVTNYLMLLAGQPIHAFDLDKLYKVAKIDRTKPIRFGVRWSRKGDKLLALNDKGYIFEDKEALLITFYDVPVAIAGIIGGKATAVDDSTSNVAFEIATFDKIDIRTSSMRLGIFTDASVVFSRQQDPEKVPGVVEALSILLNHRPTLGVDKYIQKRKIATIEVNVDRLSGFLDLDVKKTTVERLKGLGFDVKQEAEGRFSITVPSFRFDVSGEHDIAEEIVRLEGYKKVKTKLPKLPVAGTTMDMDLDVTRKLRNAFVTLGGTETQNYSFVSHEQVQLIPNREPYLYRITNAVSPEVSYVRNEIVTQLLWTIRSNKASFRRVFMFEIGKVFDKRWGQTSEQVPVEHVAAASVMAGDDTFTDFYTVKRILLSAVMEPLRIKSSELGFVRLDSPVLNQVLNRYQERRKRSGPILDLKALFAPVRSAYILKGDTIVGILGEISAKIKHQLAIEEFGKVVALYVDITDLLSFEKDGRKAHGIGRPIKGAPIIQDICFVIDNNTFIADIEKGIRAAVGEIQNKYGEDIVRDFFVIDIYPYENNRNVTFRFVFGSEKRQLADKDVTKARELIINSVVAATGASVKD